MVVAAVAALAVAGAVEESVCGGAAVAAGDAVVGFEGSGCAVGAGGVVVPVAGAVEVHGAAAPPAGGAVGMADLEAFGLLFVLVAEAAEFRV